MLFKRHKTFSSIINNLRFSGSLSFLVVILLLTSCSETLEKNSATYLLSTIDKHTLIIDSDTLNVDLINGFRSLKLNSELDSLNFNGWNETKLSEEIIYKEKDLNLNINNRIYSCKSKLTFYNKKLQIIELEFPEINDDAEDSYIPEDLLQNYINKPKLLQPFELVYGKMIWANHNKYTYDIQDLITPKLFSSDFVFYNKTKKKHFVQEEYSTLSNYTYDDNLTPENGKYLGESAKEHLYENIGLSNGIKILLKNNIESYANKEGYQKNGSIISYRSSGNWLKNNDLSILIFKKEMIRDYLNSKYFFKEEKRIKEQTIRKRKKDSLIRIKKVSEI